MCSKLIVGVYSLIVLCIERRAYLENLEGKMMVIFDLLMVSRGVMLFLAGMIMLYLRKYLSTCWTGKWIGMIVNGWRPCSG